MTNQKPVIESLCHLTSTGDEADRCYASRALGALGDTSAIPTLVQCLRDEDIDVSIDAAEALGRIGNPSAVPALLDSLTHDPNGEVKTAVVKALGQIGGADVIVPLLEIAKSCPEHKDWDDTEDWDAWWDMQLLAVEALGRLRSTEAIPVLASILGDEEGQAIESEALTALALIGGEGDNVLNQRLTSGSPTERRRAATALGLSKSPEAHKALAYAMTDREGEVRVAALRALGKLGASQYIDIMLRCLKDPEPLVRGAAIEVTADLSVTQDNVDRVRDKLAPLLTDSSPLVRAATLKAMRGAIHIVRVPTPVHWSELEQIRQCLTDQDNTVVSAACTLLAHLGDNSVLTVLLQMLSDQKRDAGLRSTVATALGILGNTEAVGILSWAVKDEAQPVRLAALNALMQLEKLRESEVSKPTDADAQSPADIAVDNEQAPRTPLSIIIAALKGKVEPAKASTPAVELAKASMPAVESAKASTPPTEPAKASTQPIEPAKITPNDAQADGIQSTVDSDTPTIEQRPAMSTLEAIAMDNVEAALLMNESADTAGLPQNLEGFNEEIQEYMAIAQENIALGERLFVQKKMEVAADVRHLSARILGNSDHIEAVRALIEVLNDDEPILRREAAESLGHIARRSPETNGLANALNKLTTFMNVGDNELRLACTRTLGVLGKRSAIPVLYAGLQDNDASVRTQTIQSLTALIPTHAEQRQQIDVEMASEEINIDAIIAQFVEKLHDASASVRKAAAAALATLRHFRALDLIIDAAFMDGGATARDMGKVLRILDVEQSGAKLLKRLESVPDSIHRRFVIEMLEEVFTT